jgi:hypothetical protein
MSQGEKLIHFFPFDGKRASRGDPVGFSSNETDESLIDFIFQVCVEVTTCR